MRIEIGAPCSLALCVARYGEAGRTYTALLGVTLQHPPVSLAAFSAPTLLVTGARADRAYEQARQWLARQPGAQTAEVEIELAIPNYMGLGSDAMLGLSVARALSELNHLPSGDALALAGAVGLGPEHALEAWGFHSGGVLLVELPRAGQPWPAPLRRHALAHPDKQAWAFALHLPPRPAEVTTSLETDRLTGLLAAAEYLSPETGQLVDGELWPALERDDLGGFAAALTKLQAANRAALERAGQWREPPADTLSMFEVMRDNGAAAWGESPTGLARYGLIRGSTASQRLRRQMTLHVGYEGGTVMASVCDTGGAQQKLQPQGQA